jgi:hypothetical protein
MISRRETGARSRVISLRVEGYLKYNDIPKGDSDEDVTPMGLWYAYETYHPIGMMRKKSITPEG